MRTISNVIAVILAATSTQALSATPVAESVTGPPPIAVDVHVINDESTPVPVVGEISAPSLTEQLQTLIEEVKKLASPAQELVNDSLYFYIFSLVPSNSIVVPEGVVLTDVILSAEYFNPDSNCYLYAYSESPGTVFKMTIPSDPSANPRQLQLHSGILSDGTLELTAVNANTDAGPCSGWIMWSGYRQ